MKKNIQNIFQFHIRRNKALRYGENPHQSAAYYVSNEFDGGMNDFEILNGKELSYNNIKDLDIAWKVANEFEETACCALKHNTPCGVAIGETAVEAYTKAHDVDPDFNIWWNSCYQQERLIKLLLKKWCKIFLEVSCSSRF